MTPERSEGESFRNGERLPEAEVKKRLAQRPGWTLSPDGKTIACDLELEGFLAAVELIREIAPLAEEADHHPDLHLTGYRRLRVELSTHSAGGVTGKDFDLAAKIDALPKKRRGA